MDIPSYSLYPEPPASGSSHINVSNPERIISAVGGLALTAFAFRQRQPWLGLLMGAAGGGLLYRGLSGHCPLSSAVGRDTAPTQSARPISAHVTETILAPREEVYRYWRQLENLPRFMHHVVKVSEYDERTSHWVAHLPGGRGRVSWDAEIHYDEPEERIAWRSVPGAAVDNAGEVQFVDSPGGYGTEVHVHISYRPPVGAIGLVMGKALNKSFEQMVKEDLQRLKENLETEHAPVETGMPAMI
ncbi:MAG: SRPBCC family protein [Verrucomicrobiota bacterium JB022]|nr:SRPBCC family protein [Verrucomicrobiota bacterium JB022]